ncbi:MAG TPA: glutathione S-transferase [Rhodospirillaceae bacterium]|nr:glutathione S-transferase [Rhodospirillaceae bacterium]
MQLLYSATSPFARKVLLLAHETGQADAIDLIATNPWAADTDLPGTNPLGMVPALRSLDGTWLYDSPVICEYLDSLHGGRRFIPADGPARWTALRRQALGDGLMDAMVRLRIETTMRPAELRWPFWSDRQEASIRHVLAALEDEAAGLARQDWSLGELTLAAALSYLDFRWPVDWRADHRRLAAWFAVQQSRPSMVATQPRE